MPTLREVQAAFRDGVLASTTPDWITPGGLPAARRFAIYRNNSLQSLTEALRDGFPVINRLIGGDCFDGVAWRFITAHPPTGGCLLDYGAGFAAHLSSDPATAGLLYLADMARLEWAWHEAFHAADEPCWTLAELGAIAAERQAALRWRLHPSVRTIESDWPLLRLFAANQPGRDADEMLDLNMEHGGALAVFRPKAEVLMAELSDGEFVLLSQLAEWGDLDRALLAALCAEPDFDFAAGLARLFSLGVFALPDCAPNVYPGELT